jgi:hypothetical protein
MSHYKMHEHEAAANLQRPRSEFTRSLSQEEEGTPDHEQAALKSVAGSSSGGASKYTAKDETGISVFLKEHTTSLIVTVAFVVGVVLRAIALAIYRCMARGAAPMSV